MRKILELLGRIIWWVCLPLLWLILNNSERTRMVLQDEEGKVLLVRGWLSGSSKWSMPGGGLHHGEDPLEGVLREVREEVGIVLDPKAIRKVGNGKINRRGFHYQVQYFAVTISNRPEIRLQRHEIAEAAWMDPQILTPANAQPDVLETLRLLARHD